MTKAFGSGLSATTGYYSIDASNSSGDTKIANFGHVRLAYDHLITDRIAASIGYSIYSFSATEFGYGLDIGTRYFPLTSYRYSTYQTDALTLEASDVWRPFFGIGFNQRQYQTVQSSYAGLSVEIGFDYALYKSISLQSVARIAKLRGPLSSRISELSLTIGLAHEIKN